MGKLLKAILKEQQKQTKILKSIENELKEAPSIEVDPHNHTEALENFGKFYSP
jgi:hypothetical protein